MRKPTLWRYYGLSYVSLVVASVVAVLNITARGYQIEWLLEWGVKGIGCLCVGLCFLVRGLDFMLLHKRYPPFIGENAPKWDSRSRSRWVSPASLLFVGAWLTLGGIMLSYIGGRNLIDAVLEVLTK